MAKATTHGHYILAGGYFLAPKGTELPEGAEFVAAEEDAASGQSAVGLAQMELARKAQAKTAREHAHAAAGPAVKDDDDETRDKGAAPENRKKG